MRDDLVLYVSDQAHSSVARAARMLGFRPDQVRVLPADAAFRLDPRRCAAAMDADVAAGRTPLPRGGERGRDQHRRGRPAAAARRGLPRTRAWLHVDGAYGGFAALAERGRAARGLELADSVTLDPHKWLYQPFECGCVLVREGRALRTAFEIAAGLPPGRRGRRRGGQFLRPRAPAHPPARALKVWLSLRSFGLDAFRDRDQAHRSTWPRSRRAGSRTARRWS